MDNAAMKAAALPAKIKAALNSKEMDAVTHLLHKSQLKCKQLPNTMGDAADLRGDLAWAHKHAHE